MGVSENGGIPSNSMFDIGRKPLTLILGATQFVIPVYWWANIP